MKLLLFEDLDLYASAIEEILRAKRPKEEHEIIRITTELEFRRRLATLAKEAFDAAIFDVMVPWCAMEDTGSQAENELPDEVKREMSGEVKWRTGIRCSRMFRNERERAGLPAVKTIIFTILQEYDLSDSHLTPLDGELIVKENGTEALVEKIISEL